jgi:DNA-binding protein H-NS
MAKNKQLSEKNLKAAKGGTKNHMLPQQHAGLKKACVSGKGVRGGRRGAVAPKYRNPDNPAETWAGRGLTPRWLAAALKTGKKLEDFSITAPVKRGRAAPRKAGRK